MKNSEWIAKVNGVEARVVEQSTELKCTVCEATESSHWRGFKEQKPVCNSCYHKERKKKARYKKKIKYFEMWG